MSYCSPTSISNEDFVVKFFRYVPTEQQAGGGDDAASWAEEGNTDTIPDSKIPAGIARDSEIPTLTSLGGIELSAVESWARAGNSGTLPDSKIPASIARDSEIPAAPTLASLGGITTAQALALIADWAEQGNTDLIPADKLTNAPAGGAGVTLEQVDDHLGRVLIQQGTGMSIVYNDSSGTLTFSATGGGGGTPVVTDDIYFGVSADEIPLGSELTIAGVNGSGVIEGYTGSMHLLIARLATEADITSVLFSDDATSTNMVGAFSKYGSTVVPTGETAQFNVWVSNQSLIQILDVTITVA